MHRIETEVINVGIVGFGYWGPNHVRNFGTLRADGVMVGAIADRSPARRLKARETFPDVDIVEEADTLIDDPDIDALIVATPPHTHFEVARRALLAGKHVLVEKPMTTNLREAVVLADLADELELTLMVGHTYEYAPAIEHMRRLIQSGVIGKPLHIRSERVNLGIHQTHINVVWDLAPHDISIISYLIGKPPTHVRAVGQCHVNPHIEDIASLTLDFEDNLMASVMLSWMDPRKSREMTIIGSQKMVVFDDLASTEKIKIYDKGAHGPDEYRSFGEFQVTYRFGDMVSPLLENYEPLRQQSEHFIECIRTGKKPRSNAESGVSVVRTLAAAQLSLWDGGNRIGLTDQRIDHINGTIAQDWEPPNE